MIVFPDPIQIQLPQAQSFLGCGNAWFQVPPSLSLCAPPSHPVPLSFASPHSAVQCRSVAHPQAPHSHFEGSHSPSAMLLPTGCLPVVGYIPVMVPSCVETVLLEAVSSSAIRSSSGHRRRSFARTGACTTVVFGMSPRIRPILRLVVQAAPFAVPIAGTWPSAHSPRPPVP